MKDINIKDKGLEAWLTEIFKALIQKYINAKNKKKLYINLELSQVMIVRSYGIESIIYQTRELTSTSFSITGAKSRSQPMNGK